MNADATKQIEKRDEKRRIECSVIPAVEVGCSIREVLTCGLATYFIPLYAGSRVVVDGNLVQVDVWCVSSPARAGI